MFEISVLQIKNGIRELQKEEQKIGKLIRSMEAVSAGVEGLTEDGSDRRTLQALTEELKEERRGISEMKRTLSEILRCYENTEKRIVDSKAAASVRNQFGLLELSGVGQMLDSLNIILK